MGLPKRVFTVAAAANSTVLTGAGGLHSIFLREVTGVAAATTVSVFDNTAASGTSLGVFSIPADGELQIVFPEPVRFSNGINTAASGGNVNGMVAVGSTGLLRPLAFTADALLLTGGATVYGAIAAETAGAVAEWRIFDNTVIGGDSAFGSNLALRSTGSVFFPEGVSFTTGIQADVVAGAVSGTVYIA